MSGFLDYLSDKYKTDDIKTINERLLELSSLFEISQILNSSIELKSVLNNILLIPMGRLMISKGIIFLKNNNEFIPKFAKGFTDNVPPLKVKDIDNSIELISFDVKTNKSEIVPYQFIIEHGLGIFIPIKSQSKIIGLIFYGKKLNQQLFNEDEKNFLKSLANLSATAIENAIKVDEIKSINLLLDEKIQQLKTLFDIGQGLSATLDSEKIVKLLIYALMGQMLVYHYAILIYTDNDLHKLDCKGFQHDAVENIIPVLSKLNDLETAFKIDTLPKSQYQSKLKKLGIKVIIPMRHQNRQIGYILIGEKINKQDYTEIDLEFLTTIVSQAVISLENARLFKETLEKQRIEQELKVAKTIQKKLLPKEIPKIEGYEIWGLNIPSKEVGGDYFDIIPITENKLAIAIGDVSGKSVPAALLMANLQAGLRTLITEEISLAHIVGKLNNLIYENTEMDKYITFFVGILDKNSHNFQYVNAGHNPPILISNNDQLKFLNVGGIILGMVPNFEYSIENIKFNPNDLLFCYTDGINEAMNSNEEEFGEERLQKLLIKTRNLAVRDQSDIIVESINKFTYGMPQYDDATMVITKRLI